MKCKMTLCYDGTLYSGWQKQPNGISIQETVESKLCQILQSPIPIVGASRTDAGVHAKAGIAHFSSPDLPPLSELQKSLNALLPPDIRILSLQEVSADFHARYDAKAKLYRYRVITDRVLDPFMRDYALHYTYPLDFEIMREVCRFYEGTHDFRSFTNEGLSTYSDKNSVKTLYSVSLERTKSGFDILYYGNSFLYKMVRNLTGTLLEMGRGKLLLSDLEGIFAAKDRRKAGMSAEAKGLSLEKVFFDLREISLDNQSSSGLNEFSSLSVKAK